MSVMKIKSFDTLPLLVKYSNEMGIEKDNIVTILKNSNGDYTLIFYWEE